MTITTGAAEPSPKVVAGGVGSGIGAAGAILFVSILNRNGVDLSDVEVGAITALVTAGVSALAGWLKRDRLREVGAKIVTTEEYEPRHD